MPMLSVKQISPAKPWYKVTLTGLIKTRYLQLIMLPGLIWFIIFAYGPMYGVLIAFKDFSLRRGVLGSRWVGLKYFIEFFSDPNLVRLISNTILLNFYSLAWGFFPPIIFALILNEVRNRFCKKFIQTVSSLPTFLSAVIVVGMLFMFMSPDGFINLILKEVFHIEPIYFMTEAKWFRTIFIGSGIWQGLGWGAIIYLAQIAGVDPQIYEAASIDGASRLRKMWHITLGSIRPGIVLLLIYAVGNMLSSGATGKIILMYNPLTYETADIIGTYVYRRGYQQAEYSFGTAVGLMNSFVNFLLLVFANTVSKKLTETSLW